MRLDYLDTLPKAIPPGKVLVHNVLAMTPRQRLGVRGFRAWWQSADEAGPAQIEVCHCPWLPELGTHFKTKRSTSAESAS